VGVGPELDLFPVLHTRPVVSTHGAVLLFSWECQSNPGSRFYLPIQ
jgi:hypothetical protein